MPTKRWLLDHGYDYHLYGAWLNMRNRCNNPKGQDYGRYGGRGIRVCKRWDSYAAFAMDVGPHPGAGWTLDRKDNDADYRPGNVRWATRQEQAQNRGAYIKVGQVMADAIRADYKPGVTRQVDLAAKYGLAQADISQITRNVRWAVRDAGVNDGG